MLLPAQVRHRLWILCVLLLACADRQHNSSTFKWTSSRNETLHSIYVTCLSVPRRGCLKSSHYGALFSIDLSCLSVCLHAGHALILTAAGFEKVVPGDATSPEGESRHRHVKSLTMFAVNSWSLRPHPPLERGDRELLAFMMLAPHFSARHARAGYWWLKKQDSTILAAISEMLERAQRKASAKSLNCVTLSNGVMHLTYENVYVLIGCLSRLVAALVAFVGAPCCVCMRQQHAINREPS